MRKHVVVCVPSYDGRTELDQVAGFLGTQAYCSNNNIKLGFLPASGHPYLDGVRNYLVHEALKVKAEYILFVDADVIFSWQDFMCLWEGMMADPKKLMIAGLYPRKNEGLAPSSLLLDPPEESLVDKYYVRLRGCATGFVLINTDLFRDEVVLKESELYMSAFNQTVHRDFYTVRRRICDQENDLPSYQGEDIAFSDKVWKAGYTIYGDIRCKLIHVGRKGYQFSLVELEDEKKGHEQQKV